MTEPVEVTVFLVIFISLTGLYAEPRHCVKRRDAGVDIEHATSNIFPGIFSGPHARLLTHFLASGFIGQQNVDALS